MDFREKILSGLKTLPNTFIEEEIGFVVAVDGPIVIVNGFNKIAYNEKVVVSNNYIGYVALIQEKYTKIVMLDDTNDVKIGDKVARTNDVLSTNVGDNLIGRIVDGLGRPTDGFGLSASETLPIERISKQILERCEIDSPLETGIKIIDSLIPIGKGQRELILGDRQSGKTAIAVDAILNQKDKDVICIYCSIAQRTDSLINVIETLKKFNAMEYTIIVNASARATPGMQVITPFAATSIAEYFCEKGRDVLIIYDDLTKHARAYREISLLLEKTPGREAFPGDIFYLHSRLLERSVKMLNGGTITSLPIIETDGENLSAYIPTNVISITDGQLYLSPALFAKGNLPAIDIGKSVSRVGSKAQLKALKQVAGKVGIEYSQFEELEMFSKFSTKLDTKTQKIIDRGKTIREILKQSQFKTMSNEGQVAIFICVNAGIFDDVPLLKMELAQQKIVDLFYDKHSSMVKKIRSNMSLLDENIKLFSDEAKEYLAKN